MKLNKLAASLALIVGTSAIAGIEGKSDRASSATSPSVAFTQEVLDRNFNPFYGKSDHYNRIYVSGLIQAFGGFSTVDSQKSRFGGEKKTIADIGVPRANLYVDAMINEWTTGHVALSFFSDIGDQTAFTLLTRESEHSYRRFGYLDEAVVTVGNLQQNPAYFRAGIGYVPFGNYERNQLRMSLVQTLTQTQVPYAQVGFVDGSGFNGAVYAFRGAKKHNVDGLSINNGGAQIGYCMDEGNWGVDVTADWIYNMAGAVNALTVLPGGVQPTVPAPAGGGAPVPYRNAPVAGLHLGAKGHFQEFDGQVAVVSSMKAFSNPGTVAAGKKPGALHVEVGFNFPLADMDSRIGVNYQQSFNGTLAKLGGLDATAPAVLVGGPAGLIPALNADQRGLAQNRVAGSFTMKVVKNVEAGLHLSWDRPYQTDTANRFDSVVTGLVSLNAQLA